MTGYSVAGIILSGGLNSRMGGCNKAFLPIGYSRFLDRIITALSDLFTEIMLVTREPEIYDQWKLKIVNDIFEARSPLAGIHAGLINMRADYAFCTACDTPFLKKDLIKILVNEIHPSVDIVVPFWDGNFQPLCAIYSKQCVDPIEAQLDNGDLRVDRLFEKVRHRKVPYKKFRKVDSALDSFFNVNTLADFQVAAQKSR